MSEYEQTFDHNIFIGHCDLISWFSDFSLYLCTHWFLNIIFLTMFVYDNTIDLKEVLGHCDLITWFSDFAF